MRVWMNGSLLPDAEQPALSVTDHGFTVGDGVFEAVKVVDGTPFALTRHLTRLGTSAAGLGLPAPDLDRVRSGLAAVLDGFTAPLGRLRITWTAGPAPMGSGRGHGTPTLVVGLTEMEPYPETTAAVLVPWTRNESSAVAGLKTTSYAENVVALAYAAERGAGEAVFANTAGNLCEGTGSNVFYVVDGQVRTPTLASGCLAGVTRALVLEWTDAVEVDEPVEVLESAEEIFLVSTTRDVQGLHRWNDRPLPAPGPVTRAVAATWSTRERENLDP